MDSTLEALRHARAYRSLPDPARRRAIRRSAGLSQQQVADAVGVSRVTVTLWESGSKTPSGAHLRRYVELLELLDDREPAGTGSAAEAIAGDGGDQGAG